MKNGHHSTSSRIDKSQISEQVHLQQEVQRDASHLTHRLRSCGRNRFTAGLVGSDEEVWLGMWNRRMR